MPFMMTLTSRIHPFIFSISMDQSEDFACLWLSHRKMLMRSLGLETGFQITRLKSHCFRSITQSSSEWMRSSSEVTIRETRSLIESS